MIANFIIILELIKGNVSISLTIIWLIKNKIRKRY